MKYIATLTAMNVAILKASRRLVRNPRALAPKEDYILPKLSQIMGSNR